MLRRAREEGEQQQDHTEADAKPEEDRQLAEGLPGSQGVGEDANDQRTRAGEGDRSVEQAIEIGIDVGVFQERHLHLAQRFEGVVIQ